jgi:hypothetical protein
MIKRLWIPVALLVSIAAGTLADSPATREVLTAGPYRVLSGDFHLHSGLGSGGSLTPWGLVTEAQRQGLDVVALTGHNETWDAHVAHAFARLIDGPIVLVGEEVTSKTQDLVAVGIRDTIPPGLPLVAQIADVHRQGGVAIAAHPGEISRGLPRHGGDRADRRHRGVSPDGLRVGRQRGRDRRVRGRNDGNADWIVRLPLVRTRRRLSNFSLRRRADRTRRSRRYPRPSHGCLWLQRARIWRSGVDSPGRCCRIA